MVDLQVKVDDKALRRALRSVPNLLRKSLEFGFEEIGNEFIARMQDVFTTSPVGPFGGNATKTKLINRTGNLRDTLRQQVTGSTLDALRLRVTIGDSTTRDYLQIQEEGGTIRPKRASKLAIPLPANKTNAGRARFKPREVPGGFILPLARNTFIAREGDDGRLELMFVLKDEVTIPARLGFRRRWRTRSMRRFRTQVLNRRVRRTLERAGLS